MINAPGDFRASYFCPLRRDPVPDSELLLVGSTLYGLSNSAAGPVAEKSKDQVYIMSQQNRRKKLQLVSRRPGRAALDWLPDPRQAFPGGGRAAPAAETTSPL